MTGALKSEAPKDSHDDKLPVSPQSVFSLITKSGIEWEYTKDLQARGEDPWDFTYSVSASANKA